MNRKLPLISLVICLMLNSSCSPSRYEKYQSEFMGLFDTFTIIIGYAQSEDEFNSYAETIYNKLNKLHNLFDIYNEYEGLNNLYTINQNAGVAPVKVSGEIIDMLLFAKEAYNLTNGNVNVAMGSVLSIWRDYRGYGALNEDMAELPPMDVLEKARETTSINDVIIDEKNSTVFLKKKGVSLDVGAIGKGYAAALAAEAAKNAGMRSLLLSVGGNITSVGAPLDNVRSRWGIGIQDPNLSINNNKNILDTVYFNDATVSCSGGYQRFYYVDGQRYNHIINPNTLKPANLYKEVAVIHNNAGIADMLSTALFILPQNEGAKIAADTGAEVLWVYDDGAQRATEGYIKISKNLGNYSAVD